MSIKSKGRTYGRMIRRCTGLPLPVSMQIGKMVAQNQNGSVSTFETVMKMNTKDSLAVLFLFTTGIIFAKSIIYATPLFLSIKDRDT